ncbi:aminotransferase class I/II-fold pyridoxal phosphate-dependent enzyme [Terasakiella sp. A23]|uniref:aminotransferase class I/II-fold pyridoxal phosphate-dependent enzyme n=1 Tax=Terasakiella sp. FCG-A23 TaxID=3080561 RepID=UPI00295495B4|nr:aminotransferase class I/II-fold pyridoxal phosphate-dependent enzyme [Terasakiella sp. A23]MDV7339060.1 aminotransferase class I/II-fold pyridoxal phosphate-dependent enzyme [Terasakiella sp. A23]
MAIKPYARPDVRESDIDALCDVLRSQFLTTGPKVPELEERFLALVQSQEAVACSNGTTALHLASLAIGLKPGDKVIVPALTFLATANAVRMCGADVVFCDVDPETGIMRLDDLKGAEKSAGGPIKAVFPVHIGGHCADMKAISDYARKKSWLIVEDACHALGGTNHGHPVGACGYSDLACFSLHATKSFTACEGGVVTTNNPDYAERMRTLRNHGMQRDPQAGPWAYEMNELGYNYRLTDVQAALGICQIDRMKEVEIRRGEIVAQYRTALDGVSDCLTSVPPTGNGDPLLHLFQVLIEYDQLGKSRAQVMKELMDRGVGTQVHYIPVANQPYYVGLYGKSDVKGADRFYERVLALPLYSSLTDEDVAEVIRAVKEVVA